MKLFIVLLLVAVVVAKDRSSEWKQFKQRNGKGYKNSAHETHRRAIWEARKNKIDQHNAEVVLGMHSYTKTENHLSDLTDDEFQAMNKVIVPPAKEGEVFAQTDRAIPASVDLRSSVCMPAVKDQKECGSCWAHSANTPLEYQKCVKNAKNTALSFSEQQLVDCSSAYGNAGCNGGFYTYAWDYVKKAIGSQTYSSYPYTAAEGTCKFARSSVASNVTSYAWVASDEAAMATAVATYGPISVSIYVTDNLMSYSSGVFSDPTCPKDGTSINHGVVIVGYGTSSSVGDFWIVRNSWGTSWGLNGYVLFKRGVNMCNINYVPAYPIVA